ncbi:MAG: hypothetical protein AB8G17_10800 [Gammaproteobacteria bacterium]
MKRIVFLIAIGVALQSASALAQDIVADRGVDQSVDYAALARIGPWDDRNYALTADDLKLLSKNEHELSEAIPAFYRVELRKAFPDMLREGPVQYPRSALPKFLIKYTGYKIDGDFYRDTNREGDRWVVYQNKRVEVIEEAEDSTRGLDGESRITNPFGAAESSIEYNPTNPDIVIAGSNGPGSGQKMHFSTDGGVTWNAAAALPLGGTCCDPTMDWSSDGTLAYTATLGSSVFVYRSSDNGQTWDDLASEPGNDPRREVSLGGSVDKEFLHVDRSPTSPFQDNIYLTWHESNRLKVATSSDQANTWSIVSLPATTQFRGIGSDITTDAAGNVYHFWPATSSRIIWLAKSTDGGATFAAPTQVAATQGGFDFPLPSIESRRAFIYVAADVDMSNGPFADSLYAAWTDNTGPDNDGVPAANHGRIQVAYSRDGGASWDIVTPHETADSNDVDRWHPWIAVDDSGNVHVIFYDTRLDPSRTSVNLFHTVSTDGAQTFSTPERLTTVSSPNIGGGFEFGDYNGLSATLDSIISSYTDNRAESGAFLTVDVYAVGTELDVATDTDQDGVPDVSDNCTSVSNAPQRDTNGDGYGNVCDADLNDDCVVNVADLGLLRADFFATGSDLDADFNGDGTVNVADLGILRLGFFGAPGPSGQTSVCD